MTTRLYDWNQDGQPQGLVRYSADLQGPKGGAVGVDGESRYEDVYLGGPDVNPDLSGYLKYAIYREMMLSDPVVKSVLWYYKLPIRAASWTLEPAGENPQDREVVAYLEELFGVGRETARIDLTWDAWLQQTLKFLDWGAQFEEMVWQPDTSVWAPPEGPERIVRDLARMAPRSAPSIDRIETDPLTGAISRLRQHDMNADDWIPGPKIQAYTLDKEGGSWWGISLLRPMYAGWKLKKALMIAAGVGFDRWAAGTPVVRYPAGDPRHEETANKIGRTIRLHERGYVTLVGTKDEGWDVEILNGSGSIADPVPLLRHYDGQISQAGLAQFGQLGSTEVGARAVGEVIAEPFYLAVQSVARHIVEERMRQTLRKVVDVNFGVDYELPLLRCTKIQARNSIVLATALADLTQAGLSFTDRDTQNDVRDILNLRHLPEVQAALDTADAAAGTEVGVAITPSSVVPAEGGSIAA